jgi:hypothetical protein
MLGARLIPRLRHTISVRDDRPPSKQAARSAPSNSAVASAACLEGGPGPVTPSTVLAFFANYRRKNAPNARGPSPTLISPVTFSSTASITLIELLSQFATMICLPSAVAAIPSG